jgi:Activator of Hsp90 ATPase homolog 1-like protein
MPLTSKSSCPVWSYDRTGAVSEQVVEVDEFETEDPALRDPMTITITLADLDGGTELVAVHDGLPPGVAPADNETGWRMALDKLAALVEAAEEKLANGDRA